MAPLLCAGLISYRAYRAAARPAISACTVSAPRHLLAQVAGAQGRRVFAFTRPEMPQASASHASSRGVGRWL